MENFISKFNTEAEYNTFKASSGYVTPHVSYVIESNEVYYSPYDYSDRYLTFIATESGTFKFSGNSISYSTNGGSTWTALASNTNSPTVSAGNKIMWKATGLTPTSSGIGTFSSSGRFTAEGNAMSLYYGDNFVGQKSLSGKDYALYGLFSGCTGITSAENLALPATTLAMYCYYNMFRGCTSLTTAPNLPATTLPRFCYEHMFDNCTSLTTAPELPATTLEMYCYDNMFRDCTSLTTAPTLPARTLKNSCYNSMFYGCTSLTTAPELPATTLATYCYQYMFDNCTSLTTAPVLSATTLQNNCYDGMFRGCTSLTTAPTLPARTLKNGCYQSMFFDCTSLNYIKAMFTTTPSSTYTQNWVSGVAASGTFVRNSAAAWGISCGVNTYPCNWTVQTASS